MPFHYNGYNGKWIPCIVSKREVKQEGKRMHPKRLVQGGCILVLVVLRRIEFWQAPRFFPPHPTCPCGNIFEDLWTCGRFFLRPTLWAKGLLIFSLLRMVHTEFRNIDLKFKFIDNTGPFVCVRTIWKKKSLQGSFQSKKKIMCREASNLPSMVWFKKELKYIS